LIISYLPNHVAQYANLQGKFTLCLVMLKNRNIRFKIWSDLNLMKLKLYLLILKACFI
jgi:hypothetical protein